MALGFEVGVARSARSFSSALSSAAKQRAGLALATVLAALAAAFVPAPSIQGADADLVALMRGMAALKALLVLGAYAVVHWRMGRALSAPVSVGYAAGVAVMAAGVVLIWRLAYIAETAVVFHLAMIALFLLAMKDGDFVTPGRRTR